MSRIDRAIREYESLEAMAHKDQWMNRLHPLVKFVVTVLFIALTVSVGKYNLAGLLLMAVYPLVMFITGELSVKEALRRLKIALPLILAVGIFNPLFDRETVLVVGGIGVSGGVLSMLRVAEIVCLSSSYSVIFEKTGLLLGIKKSLSSLSRKTSPFTASALTALLTGMVACNQTLAILLTEQLCGDLFPEKEEAALALEDTAVVIPALIPWCIAGSVPLATIGAPAGSYLFACYLYLLPVWGVLRSLKKKRQEPETPGRVCGIP